MKIAVYFDVPFGGANVSMMEILKRLKKNHTVHIYKNKNGNFKQLKTSRIARDLQSIFFQRFIQQKQAREIDHLGYDLVFVSHDCHFQAPWILRFLKTPTVFLCQEPTRAFFENFLRIDKSLPITNRIYESIIRFTKTKIEIQNSSFANKIIANSVYSVESIFRAYGVTATPIYLGVDTKVFRPMKVKKQNQVIIIGNDEPQKDLDFALTSLSLLDVKIRPTLLIASPRQRNFDRIIDLAANLNVKIRTLTGLKSEQLAKNYNESIASLATAHLEPFGLSVIESLACGIPVIAVNEAGFRETIVHKKNGLLSTRDPKKFAFQLEKIISDKIFYKKISNYGPSYVSKKFTWDITVNKIEKIFDEVA